MLWAQSARASADSSVHGAVKKEIPSLETSPGGRPHTAGQAAPGVQKAPPAQRPLSPLRRLQYGRTEFLDTRPPATGTPAAAESESPDQATTVAAGAKAVRY